MTSPVQIGLELSKVLFTDAELAVSTLTGRRVHGQSSKTLDPDKLCLIDNLVQQKCGLGEAEFSAVRSGIRDSLANRCKYLRLKCIVVNLTDVHLLLCCYCHYSKVMARILCMYITVVICMVLRMYLVRTYNYT